MTIGSVNVSRGGFPINVYFQEEEPVIKEGIWVKTSSTKRPKILSYNLEPTPFAIQKSSFNNLTLQMASVETDNYFVFYTRGRQQQNYSGNEIFVLNKVTRELRRTGFFFNDSTRPAVIGDTVYFPFQGHVKVFNPINLEFTQFNLPDSTAGGSEMVMYYHDLTLNLFATHPGFYPRWFKINLDNLEVTEMPRLSSTSMPTNPEMADGNKFYYYNDRDSNNLNYLDLQSGELTSLGYKNSKGLINLYLDDSGRFIVSYNRTSKSLTFTSLDSKEDIIIPLGENYFTGTMDNTSRLVSLQTSHQSSGYSVPKINLLTVDKINKLYSDMLLINTSDLRGVETNLVSSSMEEKQGVVSAVYISEGKIKDIPIYVGSYGQFSKLERMEVYDDR